MPLIIPSNSISGEFEVANSLRFNDDSSDYLNRTPSTTTNRKTFTISFWIKSSTAGGTIFSTGDYGAGDGFFNVRLSSSGRLVLDDYNQGTASYNVRWVTPSTTVFRDPSAWYHMVISVDSTQATLSDRVNFYLNGENIDSLFTDNASGTPSQNADFHVNYNKVHQIGRNQDNTDYFDGYIAEFVMIDGQQLTPTSFGEFDADTGIWKPIDVSGLTFGTNGFYLDFENSGSLGADVSGNGNNFTVNNLTSIDQTTDTPTNNYDTANPLIANGNVTYAEGNLQTSHTYASQWRWTTSTIGVDTGKWYAEFKVSAVGSETAIGIMPEDAINGNQNSGNDFVGKFTDSVAYLYNGQIYKSNSIDNTTSTYTTNDIIGIALDLDSNSIQFYKNGSSVGTAVSLTANKNYFFGCAGYNTAIILWNFGNPPFTISSGNSDGNGKGNFEYAVPSGYYSLNTKNLSEFG